MKNNFILGDAKKYIFILMSFFPMFVLAQTTYTDYQRKYKDGDAVYYFDNDKLSIFFRGYIDKMSYNAKEFFVEITILPKKKFLEIDPTKITAYAEVKGRKKEIDFYTYEKYMDKVKRNLFLWGSGNVREATISSSENTNVKIGGKESSVNSHSTTTISSNRHYYEEKEKAESWIKEHYLRRNTLTLEPWRGVIVAKKPAAYPVHFAVSIDGDTYVFDMEKGQ